MQIKSDLTIYLTRKAGEDFAERTVACERVIISVVQLLQARGFRHWYFGHVHFIAICKERCSRRGVALCFGACAWFEPGLDIWMLIQTLSSCLEIFQELMFEDYFRSSSPDLENILQSGSKQWFGAKFAITLLFPFGWGRSSVCVCVLKIILVGCSPLPVYP